MEDARMTDLEIRLTYQETALQALNDVVAAQQGVIDQLRREVDLLKRQLRDATPANIAKRAVAQAQTEGLTCCVLAGLNTPMLLRALTYRGLSLAETREKALAGGVQGCLRVD